MTNFMPTAHSRTSLPGRHSQARVDVAADRADRPISNDRERRANIHSRSEAGLGIALRDPRPDRASRTPQTLPSSISASPTGIPGQICTAPLDINCEPTH